MSDDIVAELRNHEGDYHLPPGLLAKAADIIEAQSKALAEARAALTDIASLTQTEKLLWWQMRARVALSFLTPTPENPNV